MKILENKCVSHVKGFRAVGIASGIKHNGNKDLCLVYSEVPAVSAATFTTNIVKAAPVVLNSKHIESNNTQALIINSGNANSCTGSQGYDDAVNMANITAEALGILPEETLVYSTGVIGVPLDMSVVSEGIHSAATFLKEEWTKDIVDDYAIDAIMTTDTFPKKVAVEIELDGKIVTVFGMAKGSGMIHPNMATMLSYVMTDAAITKTLLEKIHRESIDRSLNMVSVDGDTSTNDTATILANGAAGNRLIDSEDSDYSTLKEAIDFIHESLAKLIAKDGEGATKLIEVNLVNASSIDNARKCARTVITSSLVKTAMFASDVNWGRVLCAMGYSGASFDPLKVDLSFSSDTGSIQVFKDGSPLPLDEELAYYILDRNEIVIEIDLHDGNCNAKAWGCDLTYDYVKINGEYRT